MNPFVIRVVILSLATAIGIGGYLLAQANIARRKRNAMALSAADIVQQNSRVTIIAFHTDDCRQCFTMQAPALARIQRERGTSIHIRDINAIADTELANRFQIMTVPSTVIIDANGITHAINYGFADAAKLNQQIDAALDRNLVEAV